MKYVLLTLALLCGTVGARPEDTLSTRTIKYGKDGLVEITIQPHPTKSIQLEYFDGVQRTPQLITIPAGKSLVNMQLRCSKGWAAVLKVDGRQVDRETARRKTGMTRRLGL